MDNAKVLERKKEIELEFKKLTDMGVALAKQMKLFAAEASRINGEKLKLQGAYIEVCKILGVDPTDAEQLSVKPEVAKSPEEGN